MTSKALPFLTTVAVAITRVAGPASAGVGFRYE